MRDVLLFALGFFWAALAIGLCWYHHARQLRIRLLASQRREQLYKDACDHNAMTALHFAALSIQRQTDADPADWWKLNKKEDGE